MARQVEDYLAEYERGEDDGFDGLGYDYEEDRQSPYWHGYVDGCMLRHSLDGVRAQWLREMDDKGKAIA